MGYWPEWGIRVVVELDWYAATVLTSRRREGHQAYSTWSVKVTLVIAPRSG
jgi:hypothetical protein